MRTFHIQNFGCRATQADGAALAGSLSAQGLEEAVDARSAELVILNTCTVTSEADRDVEQTVRRVHRENPEARILVTGCYAQREPERLAQMPGVQWVVGNSHKVEIPEIIAKPALDYHAGIHIGDIFATTEFLSAPIEDATQDRSRPNLKVQDGCNNRCSFCVIPSVRGRSRSATPTWVVEQVRALAARYPEIVLTGVNLGRWGREPGSHMRLADLVRLLLAETGVERLRLSSVEPMDFSDDLLQLMATSPRIARHVHAPLQSGSDTVLRRMHRKYRPRHYEDRITKARAWMPDAAIGADVMVGFPGESDAEFEETVRFIERLPFTYLHVFTYSERPGTKAVDLPGSVPIPVRKERNRRLTELGRAKNEAFRRSLLGGELSAIVLDDPLRGLSSNFVPVEFATPREPGRLATLRAGSLTAKGIREFDPLRVL